MVPSKLPAPLGTLQAATATEEAELKLIFPVLADAVGCTLPQIDFTEFVSVVKEFEATSRQFKEMAAKSPIATTDGLSPHELATLVEIAEQTDSPGERVSLYSVRQRLEKAGHRGLAVNLALKMLSRKDFVETSIESGTNEEYPAVRVSEEGWDWLEANKDNLPLTTEPIQTKASSSERLSEDIPF